MEKVKTTAAASAVDQKTLCRKRLDFACFASILDSRQTAATGLKVSSPQNGIS
jgi:hypothetical protein